MTSYDSGGSYHGVVAVEAVLGAAVVVVAVATSRLRRHLVPKRAVGDEVVRRLALVAALREGAVRALRCYVVGEIPTVITPETRGQSRHVINTVVGEIPTVVTPETRGQSRHVINTVVGEMPTVVTPETRGENRHVCEISTVVSPETKVENRHVNNDTVGGGGKRVHSSQL